MIILCGDKYFADYPEEVLGRYIKIKERNHGLQLILLIK